MERERERERDLTSAKPDVIPQALRFYEGNIGRISRKPVINSARRPTSR